VLFGTDAVATPVGGWRRPPRPRSRRQPAVVIARDLGGGKQRTHTRCCAKRFFLDLPFDLGRSGARVPRAARA